MDVRDGSGEWSASAIVPAIEPPTVTLCDPSPSVATDGASKPSSRMARLYKANAPGLGRLAYLLTGDRDLAEELAQESLARAFGRLGQLRQADRFEAYARRVLVNLIRKRWHRVARERAWLDREAHRAAAQAVIDPAEVIADAHALWDALLRLPERQRAAIVLRYYSDLTERATAEALGCRVGTVKSLVHRGLATMRSEIEGTP